MIKNYIAKKSDKLVGDNYAVSFELSRVHKSLANAIRRVCLSEIPVVSFDDTYHNTVSENNIKIHKNISVLHNEFIAHRLSLLPICMYKSPKLKLVAHINSSNNTIVYEFKDAKNIPQFSLKIKNDQETRTRLGTTAQDNIIDVTTEYFEVSEGNIRDYFIPDYITGDYPLIHIIKPISTTEEVQNAEELIIDMSCSPGIGKENARNCAVGTITYEFVKDDQSVIDTNFDKYMSDLQAQRVLDKLPLFSEDDISQFRNSYMLLDAEKIYKRDSTGEPDTIKISVESVGNLEAKQIVYDAISILKMKTYNLMNSIKWVNDKYVTDNNISVRKNNKNGFVEICISGENHTMGNLIGCYLQDIFVTQKTVGDYLTFASYKMPHPSEEKIVIVVGIDHTKDLSNLFGKFGYNPTLRDEDSAINCMFMAMSAYLYKLDILLSKWSEISGVTDTSFEVADIELKECKDYDRNKIFATLF
jgi:DNA-directed RNA polymerase subunit L